MEIIDFLRAARKRLAILILVPLLSGLLAAAYVYQQPTRFTSSALVSAPALVGPTTNQYNGAQGVLQFASAFQAAGESAVVLQKVADATHVPPPAIDRGLTIAQVGASSIMRVSYEARNKSRVDDVARVAATETLTYLFGSQVPLAQHRVDEATKALGNTEDAMAALRKSAGAAQPDALYQSKQDQLIGLEQQQVQLQAAGNSTGAAGVANQIAAVRRELARLEPLATKYTLLSKQRDSTVTLLTTMQQALFQAQYQAEAANPSSVVTMTATHPTDRTPLYVQKVLPAVGAGLFLAVLLVAALELLRRRRLDDPARALPTRSRRKSA